MNAAAMGAGVLHARTAARSFGLARHDPPADLAPFVDYFWVVRWDLRGQPPHEQAILPHPTVTLAFEETGAAVFGVDRAIFTRRLAGTGKALGVRFRPGGFRPFYSSADFYPERPRGSRPCHLRPGGGPDVRGGHGRRR